MFRWAAVLRWIALTGWAGGASLGWVTPASGSPLPDATSFGGLPSVGALFRGDTDAHFCSAAVVNSPGRDLLVTAAHCLSGSGKDVRFVPDYHDGAAPFGVWTVDASYASQRWLASRDAKQDVAFLAVASQRRDGRTMEIEDVVGSFRPTIVTGSTLRATVVGYPSGMGGRPITCTNRITDHDGYPTFDCGGFVDGTSGGPWLTHVGPSGRGADLVGVIGGLQQGGCTPSTSYSPPFDAAVLAEYARAERGGPGEMLPDPGSDGC